MTAIELQMENDGVVGEEAKDDNETGFWRPRLTEGRRTETTKSSTLSSNLE